MIVMHEFNIPPHLWDCMPKDSRLEMMAYVEIKGLMSSYQLERDE